MKKITFLLLFLPIAKMLAQDPQLFANSWYLHEIVISGQHYFRPQDTEPGAAMFSVDGLNISNPSDSSNDWYSLTYHDVTSFDAIYGGGLIGFGCSPECMQFYIRHGSIYRATDPSATLDYSITPIDGHPQLVVTNINGDQAIYGDTALAVENFVNTEFAIWPNPVRDMLRISSSQIAIDEVQLYDIFGEILPSEKRLSDNSIDVKNLPNGVYIAFVKLKNGNILKKKFVKF